MSDSVITKLDGRLLRVTMNRPEDNGATDAMAAEIASIVSTAHETADAVLLRSIGPDFCTGRVREAGMPPPAKEAFQRRPEYDGIFGCYKALRGCQVPVIGAIEGRAMGFGAAIAALCDVAICSDTATFNIPEMTHNVAPTMVMSALYDRINRNAILWMTYSADFINAQTAMNYGFVSTVVPAEKLDAEVERFCETALSRPRPGLFSLKEYLRVAPEMSEQGAIDYARSLHSIVNTAAQMKKKH